MVTTTEATKTSRGSLEKAGLNLSAGKTQIFLALLLITASCFIAYGSALKMGFLLDDFLHLDYCARALCGEPGPLINNLISNWGGSDIMKSYRPTVSFSIFIDYLLFHTNAAGYHLTNILAFIICSGLVAMVTMEIAGRLGSRTPALPALWAGLLFSVYPLHAESVAWIIGRVDTLATMFYLASLFCFLRLRLLEEKIYLVASLIFFVLALTSKETAVSLPLAIALLSLLPQAEGHRDSKTAAKLKSALLATLPYVLLLGGYAMFRQLLLGTAVGGYGSGGLGDILRSLKIFADRDSLTKIFVPVSEEYSPVRSFATACLAPIIVIAAAFVSRQLTMISRAKYSWLPAAAPLSAIFWLALALVPAFQIWHIYPNLVGSRLFFLSSAGLCIALPLLALPITEAFSRRVFTAFTIAGLIALTALYLVWFNILNINLTPWTRASELMKTFETQLRQAAAREPNENQIMVLNLPQDYKGAGMLGRKLYLDIANRKPFSGGDLSPRLAVMEPKISGSKEYIYANELRAAASGEKPAKIYIWSGEEGKLVPFARPCFDAPVAAPPLGREFAAELAKMPSIAGEKWQAVEGSRTVVKGSGPYKMLDMARGGPGETIIWLGGEAAEIDPRAPSCALLSLDVQDEYGLGMISRCQVIWRDSRSGKILGEAGPYFDRHRGQYLLNLSRYRSYLLAPGNVQLGLRLKISDRQMFIKPESLTLQNQSVLVPNLSLQSGQINWDASDILRADKWKAYDHLSFYVTGPGTTIDAQSDYDLYQPSQLEKAEPALILPLDGRSARGSLALTKLLAKSQTQGADISSAKPGQIYQIVLFVTGKDGKVQSLPSAPITLEIGAN